MDNLNKLKKLIDEENYPYFDDEYLLERLSELESDDDIKMLARDLCIVKSGIEEIKLGDIVIPSPKRYFMLLASRYRRNMSRTVVRADGQK